MPAKISRTTSVSQTKKNQSTGTQEASSLPTVFIPPPPPAANIPVPPSDYTAPTPGAFRSVAPRQSELASLPQAVTDLKNFPDYAQVVGGSAPSLDEVTEGFDLARQWSSMRQSSTRWDAYCQLQEGLAWQAVRGLSAGLRPAFALAVQANPKLATKYAGLTSLLNAKKTIAQKAASTRRMNKEARAQGKPETHGQVGKRAQRRAAMAALAASSATTPPLTPPPAAPAPVAASPVATPAPADASAPPRVAAPAAVASPEATATNGTTPS